MVNVGKGTFFIINKMLLLLYNMYLWSMRLLLEARLAQADVPSKILMEHVLARKLVLGDEQCAGRGKTYRTFNIASHRMIANTQQDCYGCCKP